MVFTKERRANALDNSPRIRIRINMIGDPTAVDMRLGNVAVVFVEERDQIAAEVVSVVPGSARR